MISKLVIVLQGVLLWKTQESKDSAAEHFVRAVKLNPQNAVAFRYLGLYYSEVSVDVQRALKCYQRAVSLSPDDSDSGVIIYLLLLVPCYIEFLF